MEKRSYGDGSCKSAFSINSDISGKFQIKTA